MRNQRENNTSLQLSIQSFSGAKKQIRGCPKSKTKKTKSKKQNKLVKFRWLLDSLKVAA